MNAPNPENRYFLLYESLDERTRTVLGYAAQFPEDENALGLCRFHLKALPANEALAFLTWLSDLLKSKTP